MVTNPIRLLNTRQAFSPALVLVLAMTVSLSACTFVTEKLSRDDSYATEIESTVTNALRSATAVSAAPIEVDFKDEQIVLTGFVESAAESDEAEAIAKRIYPEIGILNKLEVP